jgi:hypothetical protein
MKRLFRIVVKTITLPVALLAMVWFYFISLGLVLWEWLFEVKDPFYSFYDNHKSFQKGVRNYFVNFFA